MNVERITHVIFSFPAMSKERTIVINRLDNGWCGTEKYTDKVSMHKRLWVVLHSPKLASVDIVTAYYSSDIASALAFCTANSIPCTVIWNGIHFTDVDELKSAFNESQQRALEHNITEENRELLRTYCKELLKYPIADILEILQSQIKLSGYDVSLTSEFITDGLNHGRVETASEGVVEWSRKTTKHYIRYNTQLNDLLRMYINCKWYASHDIKPDSREEFIDSKRACEDCGRRDCKNCPHLTADFTEDIVVPSSACGEYTQMLFN